MNTTSFLKSSPLINITVAELITPAEKYVPKSMSKLVSHLVHIIDIIDIIIRPFAVTYVIYAHNIMYYTCKVTFKMIISTKIVNFHFSLTFET